ncbi:hypothetical protein BI021_gp148 [Salmonella phage NR01]|uniref:Uncharacterized protein n=1 Tax=Salmonella phage NR01 TaxID=1647411 RepID=A0A162EB76_9CAUD|nr:hypothetical protein BI021_gp148 [Salmonella phage NR01]AKN44487.1 hypothetical protein NR01_0148 [Salmonella phage NR01]
MLIENGFANPASFQLWLYHNWLMILIVNQAYVDSNSATNYQILTSGRSNESISKP